MIYLVTSHCAMWLLFDKKAAPGGATVMSDRVLYAEGRCTTG